jgi:hypothetical protein
MSEGLHSLIHKNQTGIQAELVERGREIIKLAVSNLSSQLRSLKKRTDKPFEVTSAFTELRKNLDSFIDGETALLDRYFPEQMVEYSGVKDKESGVFSQSEVEQIAAVAAGFTRSFRCCWNPRLSRSGAPLTWS